MASKYYYNDVILPALPNTGSYSNHYIIGYSGATGYDDGYLLLATDAAAFCSTYVEFPTSAKALAWTCTDGKAWNGGSQYDVSDKYLKDIGTLVWTHYDICYEGSTSVYMEGSEPVLAVSQWAKMRALVRGIMAGLVSYGYLGERSGEAPEAAYYLYGTASDSGNVALVNGNSYVLYNGAVLPPLPKWDKTTYPYATIYITKGTSLGGSSTPDSYFLLLSDAKTYKKGTGLYPQGDIECGWCRYEWDENTWALYNKPQVGTFSFFASGGALWSNYNLLNDDGSVHVAASNPIPLASDEPVAAVHDGIKWDVRNYPYAVETYRDTSSGRYRYFFAHEYQNYFYTTTFGIKSYYYGSQNGIPKAVFYMRGPSDTGWVLQERTDWSLGTDPNNTDIAVWANFDLKYTDGSINCAASDPIPVYKREEM